MNLFHNSNKNLLYIITGPKSYILLGHYKSQGHGQITVSFEMENEMAVKAIQESKDNSPTQPEDLQVKFKLILKDLVSLANKQGVKVPGMDQMLDFFKNK
jgi:hypothetical protein